jgi:hypothetical protein
MPLKIMNGRGDGLARFLPGQTESTRQPAKSSIWNGTIASR